MADKEKELKIKATLDARQARQQLSSLQKSSQQAFSFGRTNNLVRALTGGIGFAGAQGVMSIMRKAAEAFADAAQTAEKAFQEFAQRAKETADDYRRSKLVEEGTRAGIERVGEYSTKAAQTRQKYELYGEAVTSGWQEMRRTFTSEEIEWIKKNGIKKSLTQMAFSGTSTGGPISQALAWGNKMLDPTGQSVYEKLQKDNTGLAGRLAALAKTTEQYKTTKQDLSAFEKILDRFAKLSISTVENGIELNDLSKRGLYTSDFMKQAATQTPELKKMDEQTDILRSIRDQLMSGNYKDIGGLE